MRGMSPVPVEAVFACVEVWRLCAVVEYVLLCPVLEEREGRVDVCPAARCVVDGLPVGGVVPAVFGVWFWLWHVLSHGVTGCGGAALRGAVAGHGWCAAVQAIYEHGFSSSFVCPVVVAVWVYWWVLTDDGHIVDVVSRLLWFWFGGFLSVEVLQVSVCV